MSWLGYLGIGVVLLMAVVIAAFVWLVIAARF